MISVGIDIGSYSVKVARVEGSAKGFKVLSLDDYPLPQDPTKDKALDVIEALRDIQGRHTGENVQFIVAAEQNHISSRRRSFPFRERHKILKSLPFQLEDDIPLSFENAIFEAKLTHYENGMSSVLAMACPKEHIAHQIQRMNDAGMQPSILSAEGVALGNLFEDWLEAPPDINTAAESDNQSATLVLHIGHSQTLCSVIYDGYTLDNFTVDWGGQDLAHTISIKYSIHYVEALKELRQKAFILTHNEGVTREQVTLSDILKAEADNLAKTLRLSIAKIETENEIKIGQAILSGGVAQLRNLGPYLTQKLEVPTNRLSQIENLDNLDFSSNPNNEITHIVSIGLAAEGVKRPKNPAITFLRGEFAGQNETLQVFIKQWGPMIRASLAFFIVFFVWASIRSGITSNMVELADESLKVQAKAVMGGKKASDGKIRRYIKDQQRKIKQIEVFESLQGINSALDVLKKISELAPKKSVGELSVTQLSVRNNDIEITGYTDKAAVSTQFQSNLQSYSSNGNVDIQAPSIKAPPGKKAFGLKFKASRRDGGSN